MNLCILIPHLQSMYEKTHLGINQDMYEIIKVLLKYTKTEFHTTKAEQNLR